MKRFILATIFTLFAFHSFMPFTNANPYKAIPPQLHISERYTPSPKKSRKEIFFEEIEKRAGEERFYWQGDEVTRDTHYSEEIEKQRESRVKRTITEAALNTLYRTTKIGPKIKKAEEGVRRKTRVRYFRKGKEPSLRASLGLTSDLDPKIKLKGKARVGPHNLETRAYLPSEEVGATYQNSKLNEYLPEGWSSSMHFNRNKKWL